ncbi:MAG: hypothetical protein IPK82_36610 [Polyangiaceae bacterium]|nr:hypothetical protein [Polyangiaceae bacterium]
MKTVVAIFLVASFVLIGCGEKSSGDGKPAATSTAAAGTGTAAAKPASTGGW